MAQLDTFCIAVIVFIVFIVPRVSQQSWRDNDYWNTLVFSNRSGTPINAQQINKAEKIQQSVDTRPNEEMVSIAPNVSNIIPYVTSPPLSSSSKQVTISPEKRFSQSPKNDPIVIPPRRLSSFPPRVSPVLDQGIVFYVYSDNGCLNTPRYLNETLINAQFFKDLDSMTNIALVTNCKVNDELKQVVDVVYQIDEADVYPGSQWFTRMLYNAYPPFKLNFVLDTHVWPCDSLAVKELFDRFNASDVDVSYGNRENRLYPMGAGALFRDSEASHLMWLHIFKWLRSINYGEDQAGMLDAWNSYIPKHDIRFEWLSFNWMYATHGISEKGAFSGPSRCYRSSLVVTGPVRFIHGDPSQCEVINGKNREHIWRPRVMFWSGSCNTTGVGRYAVFSENELRDAVKPYEIPELRWSTFACYNKTDLFWPVFPS